GPLRVLRLRHHSIVVDPDRRPELVMTATEVALKRDPTDKQPDSVPRVASDIRITAKRGRQRARVAPSAITLAAPPLAALLGWAMWDAYMGTPWTRDATVRAYVVTMASEVAGRIVELPVADNKYVHKGDLLMVIDPTNYTIAVSQATAAVQQA